MDILIVSTFWLLGTVLLSDLAHESLLSLLLGLLDADRRTGGNIGSYGDCVQVFEEPPNFPTAAMPFFTRLSRARGFWLLHILLMGRRWYLTVLAGFLKT